MNQSNCKSDGRGENISDKDKFVHFYILYIPSRNIRLQPGKVEKSLSPSNDKSFIFSKINFYRKHEFFYSYACLRKQSKCESNHTNKSVVFCRQTLKSAKIPISASTDFFRILFVCPVYCHANNADRRLYKTEKQKQSTKIVYVFQLISPIMHVLQ